MDEPGQISGRGALLFQELMRFKPEGVTANGWAVKAGVSRTIWADLRRHGNPSRRTLEKLLGAAGMTLAEFEALRVGRPSPLPPEADGLAEDGRGWRGAPLPPVPLHASRRTGEWGESGSGIDLHSIDLFRVIGKLDRPAALAGDRDAYAITTEGRGMWPRFRAGRRLLVSPAAPIAVGDDVLVVVEGGRALIQELTGRSASRIELRQFNPDVKFAVDASGIEAIHKVVGEAI